MSSFFLPVLCAVLFFFKSKESQNTFSCLNLKLIFIACLEKMLTSYKRMYFRTNKPWTLVGKLFSKYMKKVKKEFRGVNLL